MENPWNLRDDTGTEEIPIEISPEYTEAINLKKRNFVNKIYKQGGPVWRNS